MQRHILLRSDRRFSILIAMALGSWCALGGAAASAADQPTGSADQRAQVDAAIQKMYSTLVRIYVVAASPSGGRMQRQGAAGSGAIISKDGYVVTNHHVAGEALRITCNLFDGEEVEATRVGTDPMVDISVLKLKLETRKHPEIPLAVAEWGDSSRLKVGDVVLAMGCPLAISQSVTQGIVANTQMIMPKHMQGGFRMEGEDVGQLVRWIGHDAIIFHGNSGGPLVNLQGQIVGINEIGLATMGGAIPSNLVRNVVDELIAHGHVRRSWVGLELQPLLKSDKDSKGVLISGVIEGSPAARAGLKAGDIVTRFHGEETNAELAENMPLINQVIFGTPVGATVDVTYLRDGKPYETKVTTEEMQRALGEPQELKEWGIAVRDITAPMALELRRKDTKGALVDSVRSGGGAAIAKLSLDSGDVILKVGGKEVADVAALKQITTELTKGKTEKVPALVRFDRKTKQLVTIVKIGGEEKINHSASTKKPWSGMATQVVTSDLTDSFHMAGRHGVRVTEVFKGQVAEKAGVKVGDIIVAIGGKWIDASQPSDSEVFEMTIRRLRIGGKTTLKVLRDGKSMEVSLPLVAPPASDENVKSLTDKDFEITVRELSYNDRIKEQIPDGLQGILLQKVEAGGWASLGGLHAGDFVMSVNGKAAPSVAEIKSVFERIRKEKPRHVVFFLRRGVHTLFCEVEPDYR